MSSDVNAVDPTTTTPLAAGTATPTTSMIDDEALSESVDANEIKNLSERVDELKSAAASAREAELKLKITKLTEVPTPAM
jgi:hypothetical protein